MEGKWHSSNHCMRSLSAEMSFHWEQNNSYEITGSSGVGLFNFFPLCFELHVILLFISQRREKSQQSLFMSHCFSNRQRDNKIKLGLAQACCFWDFWDVEFQRRSQQWLKLCSHLPRYQNLQSKLTMNANISKYSLPNSSKTKWFELDYSFTALYSYCMSTFVFLINSPKEKMLKCSYFIEI